MKCRCCESENLVKFGKNSKGNQRYRCKNCFSITIENPTFLWMTDLEKIQAQKLAKEGLSERGIARFLKKSKSSINTFLKKSTNSQL